MLQPKQVFLLNLEKINVFFKDEYDPYAIPPNIEICENHLVIYYRIKKKKLLSLPHKLESKIQIDQNSAPVAQKESYFINSYLISNFFL